MTAWDGAERRRCNPQLNDIEIALTEIRLEVKNNHKAMRDVEKQVMIMLSNHEHMLRGNGKDGLETDVDRLKIEAANRKENFKLAWGAIVVCLIQTGWNMVSFLI